MARFSSHKTAQHAGRPNKNYRVPKAANGRNTASGYVRIVACKNSGAVVSVGLFFWLEVGQSTVMRVPAVVPLTSCNGSPVSTSLKTGGQSLKSKVPL
jgi:hypothetical protein